MAGMKLIPQIARAQETADQARQLVLPLLPALPTLETLQRSVQDLTGRVRDLEDAIETLRQRAFL